MIMYPVQPVFRHMRPNHSVHPVAQCHGGRPGLRSTPEWAHSGRLPDFSALTAVEQAFRMSA
eukprot:362989-Chlamydomonas_euryale.AAC.10